MWQNGVYPKNSASFWNQIFGETKKKTGENDLKIKEIEFEEFPFIVGNIRGIKPVIRTFFLDCKARPEKNKFSNLSTLSYAEKPFRRNLRGMRHFSQEFAKYFNFH